MRLTESHNHERRKMHDKRQYQLSAIKPVLRCIRRQGEITEVRSTKSSRGEESETYWGSAWYV